MRDFSKKFANSRSDRQVVEKNFSIPQKWKKIAERKFWIPEDIDWWKKDFFFWSPQEEVSQIQEHRDDRVFFFFRSEEEAYIHTTRVLSLRERWGRATGEMSKPTVITAPTHGDPAPTPTPVAVGMYASPWWTPMFVSDSFFYYPSLDYDISHHFSVLVASLKP
jgi:hypothetical protein